MGGSRLLSVRAELRARVSPPLPPRPRADIWKPTPPRPSHGRRACWLGIGIVCELSKRSWRSSLTPQRTVLGSAALISLVAGVLISGTLVWTLLVIAAAFLMTAILLPAIREVEYGFPVGIKVKAAAQDRLAVLRQSFQDQRSDLEVCAHHLCDDPQMAPKLLEAAWAQTITVWRGPPTSGLRLFVLCTLVHLLEAETRWTSPREIGTTNLGPLDRLNQSQRVTVVLKEFADLSIDEIVQVTGRSPSEIQHDLQTADLALDAASAQGEGR